MKKIYKANLGGHVILSFIPGGFFIIGFIFLKEFTWALGSIIFLILLNLSYYFDLIIIENGRLLHKEIGLKKIVSIQDISSIFYKKMSVFSPVLGFKNELGEEIFSIALSDYKENTIADILFELKEVNRSIQLDAYSKKLIEKYIKI